jgi:4-hydroxybenzoate polyprenyltransferase
LAKTLVYRGLQLLSLGLSTSFLSIALLVLSLYLVCFCFYIYNGHPGLFFSEIKVHGIVWCSSFSVAAGSIINQFYDQEKDQLAKPILVKIRSFIKLKYKLYLYVSLIVFSLLVAAILSFQIFIFFLIYHFYIWFYSHKISKILIVNNIAFVLLLLYPFAGLLFYFKSYSPLALHLLAFLFVFLLLIDLAKDVLSCQADRLLGYQSIATEYSVRTSSYLQALLLFVLAAACPYLMPYLPKFVCSYQYLHICTLFLAVLGLLVLCKSTPLWLYACLKITLLLGVLLVYADLFLMLMG